MKVLFFFFSLILLSSLHGDKQSRSLVSMLSNKKTLIIGDSITQQGDYVSFFEYLLHQQNPTQSFDIISVGLSSETASGLSEKDHPFPRPHVHERFQRSLDKVKPDIVIACYGMNDGIYHPNNEQRFSAFKNGIKKIYSDCQARKIELIVLTPPPFDPRPVARRLQQEGFHNFGYKNPYDKYHTVLEDYSQWLMSLKLDAFRCIDFNTALTQYTSLQRKQNAKFYLSRDGIHPSQAGHLLMAMKLLSEKDDLPDLKTLKTKLETIQKDPLYKLVSSRRRLRSNAWLSYIGYTRGRKVKTDSVEKAESKAAELMKQIHAYHKKP